MINRQQLSSFGAEWMMQQPMTTHVASTQTREQARADYIAARDEVRAMTAEDSGSGYLAQKAQRAPTTMTAGTGMR